MKVLSMGGLLLTLVVGCGKTANPEVCCVDAADCSAIGAAEDKRDCPQGLACIDHECVVAECSTQGCPSQAPVCNVATNVCEGCTSDADCSTNQTQPNCNTDTGGCVQCQSSNDCGLTVPVCEGNTCRKCVLDSECSIGACGDDGSCLVEQQLVFLEPGGTDSGACTSTAPCRTFGFAVSRTSSQRSHIVMRFGNYAAEQTVVGPSDTTASPLVVHGGGSVMTSTSSDGPMLSIAVPVTLRDLEIRSASGDALSVGPAPALLERVKLRATVRGLGTQGPTTLRDFLIEPVAGSGAYGILVGEGTLTLERGVIGAGWGTGVLAQGSTPLEFSNVLVYGAATLALDIPLASGNIRFSTIADSGEDTGTGPRAVRCGPSMTIHSSIVWTTGGVSRAPLVGCSLSNVIVGPPAVPGSSNIDPQFVNPTARDYHLKNGSPARDAADTGPSLDFERDPRPRGARYDLGADEGS